MKSLYCIIFFGLLVVNVSAQKPNSPIKTLDNDTLALPFEEDFTSAVFETNGWEVEGTNWRIAGQMGNPAPAVEFTYAPVFENYDFSIISPFLNGNSVTDCRIYLDFDIKFDDNTATGNERLFVEVFSDTSWNEVAQFASNGDFDWTAKKISITEFSRSKFFKIRFRATGINTLDINTWLIDNIKVHKVCEPPHNLEVSIPDPINHGCRFLLEWDAPCTPEFLNSWLHWDDGTNAGNGIGLQDGGTFYAAIRFRPEDLMYYGLDHAIKKIKLFPFMQGGPLILKIWKGNTPQCIYSQPISSYIPGQWNSYDIDSLIVLDPTQELWIGYQITHEAGQWVGGTDAGPAVVGFGDLISTDGINWDPISTFDLNYNWNIQAYIDGVPPSDTCSVLGYKIYRDGYDGYTLIDTTTETSYYDIIRNLYSTCYKVTAFYNDGESIYSNEACDFLGWDCFVAAEQLEMHDINICPNPASSTITISYPPSINNFILYNIFGYKIAEYPVVTTQHETTIDVSTYSSGIYLLRFSGNKVILERKLVIQ